MYDSAPISVGRLDWLNEELDGYWSQSEWHLRYAPIPVSADLADHGLTKITLDNKIQFEELFPQLQLRAELQFATMRLLQDEHWTIKGLATICRFYLYLADIIKMHGHVSSIVDRPMEEWVTLFREHLKSLGRAPKTRTCPVNAPDGGLEYKTYIIDKEEVSRFKSVYKTLDDFYFRKQGGDEWDRDVVDLIFLGLREKSGDPKELPFSRITTEWLRSDIKKFARNMMAAGTWRCSSAAALIDQCTYLDNFLIDFRPDIVSPRQFNRKLIMGFIDYVNHLKLTKNTTTGKIGDPISVRMKEKILGTVRSFTRDSARRGLTKFPTKDLFRTDDFPKKSDRNDTPKHIPEFVLRQMRDNIHHLSEPWRSMLEVFLELGARMGDAIAIPYDCIIYDDDNDPYLVYASEKTNFRGVPQPITPDLLRVVEAAQKRSMEIAGDECKLLFTKNKKGEPYSPGSMGKLLRRWILDYNIIDEHGNHWRLATHQCRHSVGMDIIRNGGTPIDVKNRLMHQTLAVGIVYGKVEDEQRKQTWAKYRGYIVDVDGKADGSLDNVESIDSQWLKHNLRSQALSNGYCKKPLKDGEEPCRKGNKCIMEGCKAFRTCEGFLPDLKDQATRAEALVKDAEADGRVRVKEVNMNLLRKLRPIVESLESTNK